MSAQPAHMHPTAYNTLPLLASRISRLKRKSCASSSTSPVYIKIPALVASRIPETILASALPGLYEVRTPRPAAMPMGVVNPYNAAAAMGM